MPYDAYPTQTPGQQVVAGLKAFSDSVNQLSQQYSLQQAQQQIDEANSSISDDFERTQRVKQIGQALAFQLAGAGADASKINAVMGAIPKPVAAPQNVLEGLASPNPRIREVAENYQADQYQHELDKINAGGENKLAVANINASERERKAKEAAAQKSTDNFNKQVAAFSKRDDVKPLLVGRDAVETAQQQLDQARTNPAAFQSAQVGALLASGLKRITTTELKGMTGTQGLVAKAETAADNILAGKQSQRDLDAIQAVLDVARDSNKRQLKNKMTGYSAMLGSSPGTTFTQRDYYSQLHQDLFSASDEPMPNFDAQGRMVQNQAPTPQVGGAAAPSTGTSSGAFGIPGFSLK